MEPHVDSIIPDMGEGEQRAATTTEGQPGEEHRSPFIRSIAVPKARTAKGVAACTTSVGELQEQMRGLGAWSVTDWKTRKKLLGQRGNDAGHGVLTSLVEDCWTAVGNAKQRWRRRRCRKNGREGARSSRLMWLLNRVKQWQKILWMLLRG